MRQIHIISPGFRVSNSRALIFPIIRYRQQLRQMGLEVKIFESLQQENADCSTLAIDGRSVDTNEPAALDRFIDRLQALRTHTDRVVFFDTTDSAGMLNGAMLQLCDSYLKNQVLVDRSAYGKSLYGHRSYTDYYHREFGIEDTAPMSEPQVTDPTLLEKIRTSWNAGLADYGFTGLYRSLAFRRTSWPQFLKGPSGFADPSCERDIEVHTRMGLTYHRESVAWQRRQISKLVSHRGQSDKIGRWRYFKELARSRLVLAPFGWGEFTYKDYETFIAGGTLVKPDMSHMETWPDFYRAGTTFLAHKWDLSDLDETIDAGLEDRIRSVAIATQAQDLYRYYTTTADGRDEVCERIASCIG